MMTPLALSLFFFFGIASGAVPFNYTNQIAWNSLFGSFCSGGRQSPIDIITRNVQGGNSTLTPLRMTNWDTSVNGYVLNNGHTLKFSPSSASSEARVQTFISTYKLLQFHFHWGPNNMVGSENKVNNTFFSGELHFVNQNVSAVNSVGSQFTVVAVFLTADSSVQYSGSVWEKLTESIPAFNATRSIQSITYESMLPSNLSYYYFPGSLTTPLCNEIVEWFVLQNPVSVPMEFFNKLRTLNDTNGDPLTLNYRDVQPLNGRTVSGYTVESVSGSIGLMSTTTALLAFLLIAVLANY
ncbi:PREDICTED: carbonic anhydrase 2 [Amphimedon queenslandica]|nr:PREDICTED: carbonic anhydrase 2 [Amphimedon queenslandica]DAA06052.1 TPA_inf: carbonic anhydrase 3 [Amphimedon queenslandica]|eukprot:XP_003386623.1 PREDICTED: carbonic anhydrase 2 [Amphimedon queenslandica]